MDTEHNFMECKKKDTSLPQSIEETDTPICVVHLKVERSEDIDIIDRWELMHSGVVKSEGFTDTKVIKQEPVEAADPTEIEIMIIEDNIKQEIKPERLEKDFIEISTREIHSKEESVAAENIEIKEYKGVARSETCSLEGLCLECDICQRRYINRGNLNRHLRTHTGDRPFECKICQRAFREKSVLNKHSRTHTGEKPYVCEICQRRFVTKNTLVIHSRMHTGDKPFECEICQRRFSRRNTLNMHIRTHTGEKPFECEICQRKFSVKGKLIRHLRIHTGEKPFKCEICLRRFFERSIVKLHLRTHTGEKPFHCDICQRRFSDRSNLITHLRTHRGKKKLR